MVEQEVDEPQAEVLISAAENEQQSVANMQNFNRFKRIANTVTTEPAMFLFMCSALIKFPVFQELLYEKSCLQIFSQVIFRSAQSAYWKYRTSLFMYIEHLFLRRYQSSS